MPDAPDNWIRTDLDRAAVAQGCTFDLAAAEHAREFFARFLRHSKGRWAGRPFVLADWQWRDIIGPLFGWKRPDGTRRYRSAYVEVPKKNGKSTLLAGVGLYMLLADDEPGAEIYTAAADHKQAGIIHGEAERMVRASAALSGHLIATTSRKHISHPASNSIMQALSADAYTKEGLNAHCVLFDELHAQPDRRLWDTLAYSGAARTQPLHVSITTAGYDRHSVCYEQRAYAEQVRDGIIDDLGFLPVIYAADRDADWTSPKVWRAANPSLGITIREDDLAAACKEAQASPTKENAFKRYRLNIWTEQAIRWLPMAEWDACAGEPAELDGALDRGDACYAGLDMSSTMDLSALALYYPDTGHVLLKSWLPGDTAHARARADRVPYPTWAQQGHINLTPGNVVDYDRVRTDIVALTEHHNIRQIAVDRWNSTQLMTQLQSDGFDVVPFGQGYASMTAPTKALEAYVLQRKIQHLNNPVLRWAASNVAVEQDAAGNIKPSKAKSTERIDPIVALIMAIGRAIADTPAPTGSVYDTRGILSV